METYDLFDIYSKNTFDFSEQLVYSTSILESVLNFSLIFKVQNTEACVVIFTVKQIAILNMLEFSITGQFSQQSSENCSRRASVTRRFSVGKKINSNFIAD